MVSRFIILLMMILVVGCTSPHSATVKGKKPSTSDVTIKIPEVKKIGLLTNSVSLNVNVAAVTKIQPFTIDLASIPSLSNLSINSTCSVTRISDTPISISKVIKLPIQSVVAISDTPISIITASKTINAPTKSKSVSMPVDVSLIVSDKSKLADTYEILTLTQLKILEQSNVDILVPTSQSVPIIPNNISLKTDVNVKPLSRIKENTKPEIKISEKTKDSALIDKGKLIDKIYREMYSDNLDRGLLPSSLNYDVLDWWENKFNKEIFPVKSPLMIDVKKLRMIGQIVTSASETEDMNQKAELDYFKSLGFNGALLVWKGENPDNLSQIAQYMKNNGWVVAFTFGPEELQDAEVYINPILYANACAKILPYCDFVIPAWRKATGSHIDINKDKYHNILTLLIQSVTTNIPIIGETFFKITKENMVDVGYSPYENMSGMVNFNAAYDSLYTPQVIELLKRYKIPTPYLFCVIGPVPYWDWHSSYRRSPSEALRYNIEKSKELNSLGCGAIVLAGGGGGTRTLNNIDITDDLTKTKWRFQ